MSTGTAPSPADRGDQPVALDPVHVVVLAAGRGSRLRGVGDALPKWLLPVGERTLADRQIEGTRRAGEAVASVRVVTGHAAELVQRAIAEAYDGVGVVHNPEFAELNNWWSVLRAVRDLPAAGPLAVINADLLIDPAHVAAFLREAAAGPADGLVAVDLARRVTDESMKVSRGDDGTLRQIAKVGVDAPVGEYIGMLMARGPVLRAFRAVLESFVGDEARADEWYEGAVGRTAADGTAAWHIWPVPSGDWVEIDDERDLQQAVALETRR